MKPFCQSSSPFKIGNKKRSNPARSLQKCNVECSAAGLVPIRFATLPVHVSTVILPATKVMPGSYKVLHLSKQKSSANPEDLMLQHAKEINYWEEHTFDAWCPSVWMTSVMHAAFCSITYACICFRRSYWVPPPDKPQRSNSTFLQRFPEGKLVETRRGIPSLCYTIAQQLLCYSQLSHRWTLPLRWCDAAAASSVKLLVGARRRWGPPQTPVVAQFPMPMAGTPIQPAMMMAAAPGATPRRSLNTTGDDCERAAEGRKEATSERARKMRSARCRPRKRLIERWCEHCATNRIQAVRNLLVASTTPTRDGRSICASWQRAERGGVRFPRSDDKAVAAAFDTALGKLKTIAADHAKVAAASEKLAPPLVKRNSNMPAPGFGARCDEADRDRHGSVNETDAGWAQPGCREATANSRKTHCRPRQIMGPSSWGDPGEPASWRDWCLPFRTGVRIAHVAPGLLRSRRCGRDTPVGPQQFDDVGWHHLPSDITDHARVRRSGSSTGWCRTTYHRKTRSPSSSRQQCFRRTGSSSCPIAQVRLKSCF